MRDDGRGLAAARACEPDGELLQLAPEQRLRDDGHDTGATESVEAAVELFGAPRFDGLRRAAQDFVMDGARWADQDGKGDVAARLGVGTDIVHAGRRQRVRLAPRRETALVQTHLQRRVSRVQDVCARGGELGALLHQCPQPKVARREERARGSAG